jgi:DnaJ-class molecular chaperone
MLTSARLPIVKVPERDPYQVLGVAKDADADAIKRAYRERAMRDHPDRNPDDPAAAERFARASQAYATLRDPEQRRRYDAFVARGGRAGEAPRPDFGRVDWRSVFREADVPYGAGGTPGTLGGNPVFEALFTRLGRGVETVFRQAGLLPGEDRTVTLRLTLAQARSGGRERLRLPGPIVCPTCSPPRATCPTCGGAGTLPAMEVDVAVPAGVHPGQRLRLRRMGGPGRPPGDALVLLDVALPPGIERRGRDLHATVHVTPGELRRGAAVRVAGVRVDVPPGARDGADLRVAGAGLGGDLRVTLRTDPVAGALRSAVDVIGDGVASIRRSIGRLRPRRKA